MARVHEDPRFFKTATIAAGTALSDAVDLTGVVVSGIYMSGAWTTATLSFQASPDGNTWYEIYEAGSSEYSASAAASTLIPLDVPTMWSVRYLKVRSGSSASPTNQAAERVLTLVVRPF